MKKKEILALLLTLAMVLSLAACGGTVPQQAEAISTQEPQQDAPAPAPAPEATPAPTQEPIPVAAPDPTESPDDPQIVALFSVLSQLEQDSDHEWRYAVTDLDHNGQLEVVAASQHKADRSTTLKLWELSPEMDKLVDCAVLLQAEESFPDILSENADTYHDPVTGNWYYMFYDTVLLSENEAIISKCSVNLHNQAVSYEPYAYELISAQNGVRSVSYMDLNGKAIGPEEFNAAGEQAFIGTEKSSSNFGWFSMEEATSPARLTSSYAVFTGEQAPDKTNPLPRPQPLGEVDPNPTPAADAAPLFLYITKNPTNENRQTGDTAYFVAFANIYTSLSWTFVSPDGGEYSPQSFVNKFPGVQVYGIYSTTLSIANLTKETNRWGAYCTFNYNGQTARTNTAYLAVTEKPAPATPTPAPATPTPAPVPPTPPPVDPTPPAPPTGDVIGRGAFSSQTNTGLDLCCDWVATRIGDHRADITFTLSIRSASITLNNLPNGFLIQLGTQTTQLPQRAVDYKGGMTSTYMGSASFVLDLPDGTTELPLTAVWYFNGSYGGQALREISCNGTITLVEESAPEPEPEPEPVYASMAGLVYDITEPEYRIELANGLTVKVNPSVCRLAYGLLAEGCSCTVYYENFPSAETIYLIDIYGVTEGFDPDAVKPDDVTDAESETPAADDVQPEPEPEPAPEPEPEPEPEPVKPDYSGTYKKDNFTITIKPSEGGYEVTVTYKNGEEDLKWVFHGSFDADGVLKYTDCVKTNVAAGETEYTKGKGSITISGGRLTWKDEKENVAKDLIFS